MMIEDLRKRLAKAKIVYSNEECLEVVKKAKKGDIIIFDELKGDLKYG